MAIHGVGAPVALPRRLHTFFRSVGQGPGDSQVKAWLGQQGLTVTVSTSDPRSDTSGQDVFITLKQPADGPHRQSLQTQWTLKPVDAQSVTASLRPGARGEWAAKAQVVTQTDALKPIIDAYNALHPHQPIPMPGRPGYPWQFLSRIP